MRKICYEFIAASLIILWIYTGMNKLLGYDTFKFQLGRSPFIQPIAGFIATTLPAFELILAVLLIFYKTRFWGFLLSFFLMLTFTGYIYAMLHYSYYVPCSCGGVLASLSWEDHLFFNAIYTILSLIGLIMNVKGIRLQKKEFPISQS